MLILIAALDEQNAIGKQGQLLCHLPDDLAFFKQQTIGHKIVMGRKTAQALPIFPLPDRENFVLSQQPSNQYPTLSHYQLALQWAQTEDVYVCGGAQTYNLFLPHADAMYLTRIHHCFVEADTFFPSFNPDHWARTILRQHPADGKHAYAFTIESYKRI